MARKEILSAVNQPRIEDPNQGERTSNFGPRIIDNEGIPTRRGLVDVEVNQPALRSYLMEQFGRTFPNLAKVDITSEIDKLTISFGKDLFRETVSNHSRNTLLAQGASPREAEKKAFYTSVAMVVCLLLEMGTSPRAAFWSDEKAPLLYFDTPQIIRKGKDPNKLFSKSWNHELQHFFDYIDPKESLRLKKHQKIMLAATGFGSAISCIGSEIFLVVNKMNLANTLVEKTLLVSFGTTSAICVAIAGGGLVQGAFYYVVHRGEKRAKKASYPIDKTIINIIPRQTEL